MHRTKYFLILAVGLIVFLAALSPVAEAHRTTRAKARSLAISYAERNWDGNGPIWFGNNDWTVYVDPWDAHRWIVNIYWTERSIYILQRGCGGPMFVYHDGHTYKQSHVCG
jgi:hypothetical protein